MSDDSRVERKAPRAMVERRANRRVRLRVAVELESVTSFFGFSTDVSLDGICVVADEELPIDSLVDLEFQIPPEGPQVEALGEVRWKRSTNTDPSVFVYGIEFLSLPERHQEALDELVRRHSQVVDVDPTGEQD